MWLIVGLGNPGKKYSKTRHNIGFIIADAVAKRFSIPLRNRAKNFIYGRGIISAQEASIIKPLTFMNKSGIAVRDAVRKYRCKNNIIVIQDDLDLGAGTIKIKKNGSSGGHKGIASIIETMGTKDFIRVKVGIGRSEKIPAEDYVLSCFNKEEQAVIKKTVAKAVDAIEEILGRGISYAQNKFHSIDSN